VRQRFEDMTLLFVHSWMRYLVLLALLAALYRAYAGWLGNKTFSPFDEQLRHTTATIAHIQLIFGVWLYLVSPISTFFLHHFNEALHVREVRFFGMEHALVMLFAILLISIGSARAKRQHRDREKFRTVALWYSATLFLMLAAIPWEFSPLVSRETFRMF